MKFIEMEIMLLSLLLFSFLGPFSEGSFWNSNRYRAEVIKTEARESDESCCKMPEIKTCYNVLDIQMDKIEAKEDIRLEGVKLSFSRTLENQDFKSYVYKTESWDEAVFTKYEGVGNAGHFKLLGSMRTSEGKLFAFEMCRSKLVWIEYDDVMLSEMDEGPEENKAMSHRTSRSVTSMPKVSYIKIYLTIQF